MSCMRLSRRHTAANELMVRLWIAHWSFDSYFPPPYLLVVQTQVSWYMIFNKEEIFLMFLFSYDYGNTFNNVYTDYILLYIACIRMPTKRLSLVQFVLDLTSFGANSDG